jgi:hypothetical protein
VALPLWFAVAVALGTCSRQLADRSLLLACPRWPRSPLRAAHAERSVAALIDWFTLLFFTGCALVIWVIWISLQTGVPRQAGGQRGQARARLRAQLLAAGLRRGAGRHAGLGLAGQVARRPHRAAIWKSLVLPAGGAALCWLLLMTLWLPVLDYARSYAPVVRREAAHGPTAAGLRRGLGLNRGQIAALRYHGNMDLQSGPAEPPARGWWSIPKTSTSLANGAGHAALVAGGAEPAAPPTNDNVLLYKRIAP